MYNKRDNENQVTPDGVLRGLFLPKDEDGSAVMSFNVRTGLEAPLTSIAAYIDTYFNSNLDKTVVVGVQEIRFWEQAEVLTGGRYYLTNRFLQQYYSGTTEEYGILLIANKPFQAVKSFELDYCGAREYRGAICAKLNDVWYVNTHLTHISASIECQLADMAAFINTLGSKVVLLGDVNIAHNSPKFLDFLGASGLTAYGSGNTFNAQTSLTLRIDAIAAKGVTNLATELHTTVLSDHLAISAEFA